MDGTPLLHSSNRRQSTVTTTTTPNVGPSTYSLSDDASITSNITTTHSVPLPGPPMLRVRVTLSGPLVSPQERDSMLVLSVDVDEMHSLPLQWLAEDLTTEDLDIAAAGATATAAGNAGAGGKGGRAGACVGAGGKDGAATGTGAAAGAGLGAIAGLGRAGLAALGKKPSMTGLPGGVGGQQQQGQQGQLQGQGGVNASGTGTGAGAGAGAAGAGAGNRRGMLLGGTGTSGGGAGGPGSARGGGTSTSSSSSQGYAAGSGSGVGGAMYNSEDVLRLDERYIYTAAFALPISAGSTVPVRVSAGKLEVPPLPVEPMQAPTASTTTSTTAAGATGATSIVDGPPELLPMMSLSSSSQRSSHEKEKEKEKEKRRRSRASGMDEDEDDQNTSSAALSAATTAAKTEAERVRGILVQKSKRFIKWSPSDCSSTSSLFSQYRRRVFLSATAARALYASAARGDVIDLHLWRSLPSSSPALHALAAAAGATPLGGLVPPTGVVPLPGHVAPHMLQAAALATQGAIGAAAGGVAGPGVASGQTSAAGTSSSSSSSLSTSAGNAGAGAGVGAASSASAGAGATAAANASSAALTHVASAAAAALCLDPSDLARIIDAYDGYPVGVAGVTAASPHAAFTLPGSCTTAATHSPSSPSSCSSSASSSSTGGAGGLCLSPPSSTSPIWPPQTSYTSSSSSPPSFSSSSPSSSSSPHAPAYTPLVSPSHALARRTPLAALSECARTRGVTHIPLNALLSVNSNVNSYNFNGAVGSDTAGAGAGADARTPLSLSLELPVVLDSVCANAWLQEQAAEAEADAVAKWLAETQAATGAGKKETDKGKNRDKRATGLPRPGDVASSSSSSTTSTSLLGTAASTAAGGALSGVGAGGDPSGGDAAAAAAALHEQQRAAVALAARQEVLSRGLPDDIFQQAQTTVKVSISLSKPLSVAAAVATTNPTAVTSTSVPSSSSSSSSFSSTASSSFSTAARSEASVRMPPAHECSEVDAELEHALEKLTVSLRNPDPRVVKAVIDAGVVPFPSSAPSLKVSDDGVEMDHSLNTMLLEQVVLQSWNIGGDFKVLRERLKPAIARLYRSIEAKVVASTPAILLTNSSTSSSSSSSSSSVVPRPPSGPPPPSSSSSSRAGLRHLSMASGARVTSAMKQTSSSSSCSTSSSIDGGVTKPTPQQTEAISRLFAKLMARVSVVVSNFVAKQGRPVHAIRPLPINVLTSSSSSSSPSPSSPSSSPSSPHTYKEALTTSQLLAQANEAELVCGDRVLAHQLLWRLVSLPDPSSPPPPAHLTPAEIALSSPSASPAHWTALGMFYLRCGDVGPVPFEPSSLSSSSLSSSTLSQFGSSGHAKSVPKPAEFIAAALQAASSSSSGTPAAAQPTTSPSSSSSSSSSFSQYVSNFPIVPSSWLASCEASSSARLVCAAFAFEQALSLAPKNVSVRLHLACTLFEQGLVAQSRAVLAPAFESVVASNTSTSFSEACAQAKVSPALALGLYALVLYASHNAFDGNEAMGAAMMALSRELPVLYKQSTPFTGAVAVPQQFATSFAAGAGAGGLLTGPHSQIPPITVTTFDSTSSSFSSSSSSSSSASPTSSRMSNIPLQLFASSLQSAVFIRAADFLTTRRLKSVASMALARAFSSLGSSPNTAPLASPAMYALLPFSGLTNHQHLQQHQQQQLQQQAGRPHHLPSVLSLDFLLQLGRWATIRGDTITAERALALAVAASGVGSLMLTTACGPVAQSIAAKLTTAAAANANANANASSMTHGHGAASVSSPSLATSTLASSVSPTLHNSTLTSPNRGPASTSSSSSSSSSFSSTITVALPSATVTDVVPLLAQPWPALPPTTPLLQLVSSSSSSSSSSSNIDIFVPTAPVCVPAPPPSRLSVQSALPALAWLGHAFITRATQATASAAASSSSSSSTPSSQEAFIAAEAFARGVYSTYRNWSPAGQIDPLVGLRLAKLLLLKHAEPSNHSSNNTSSTNSTSTTTAVAAAVGGAIDPVVESLQVWKSMVTMLPSCASYQLGLASTALMLNDLATAERALQMAAAASPSNPRLWSLLKEYYEARARQLDETAASAVSSVYALPPKPVNNNSFASSASPVPVLSTPSNVADLQRSREMALEQASAAARQWKALVK